MSIKKKFVAIIPAKKKSFRIPNKNLLKINGKSLVVKSIQDAKKSKYIKEIFVSTDSKKIFNIAKSYGLKNLGLRSKKFSGKLSTMHSVIKHEIKKISFDFDYLIILQPTSPYRSFKDIDNACKKMVKNKSADSLVSCSSLPENYHPKKLMLKENSFLKFFDLRSIFLNNLKINKNLKIFKTKSIGKINKKSLLLFRNGAIYITKREKISNYIIGGKIISYEMPFEKSLDINDYDDLKELRKF